MKTNQMQPIDTAPKDGTYILLFGDSTVRKPRLRCSVGHWSAYKNRWEDHGGDDVEYYGPPPTHWCPLPEVADETNLRKELPMRTCSDCEHWIKNQKRQQRNAGVCNHRDRLVHLGNQVALPLMFGHESCDRHKQRQEGQKGESDACTEEKQG